jgi:hypothetical protein
MYGIFMYMAFLLYTPHAHILQPQPPRPVPQHPSFFFSQILPATGQTSENKASDPEGKVRPRIQTPTRSFPPKNLIPRLCCLLG